MSLNLVVSLPEGSTNFNIQTGVSLLHEIKRTFTSQVLPLDYPSCPPTLGVRNPRGLDEAAVAGLLADMNARLNFLALD